MVQLEDLCPPQNEVVIDQPSSAFTSADDDKKEANSDRKPGDGTVQLQEKDYALFCVIMSMIVNVMFISQIMSTLNSPKHDDCKEQEQVPGDKKIAENNPPENAPSIQKKPEKPTPKKGNKKPRPKDAQKMKITQRVATTNSKSKPRYHLKSTFSSVPACLNGLIRSVASTVKCPNFTNSSIPRILLYLAFFAFAGHVVLSAPAELEIDQALPSQCKNTLEESRQCPNFKSEYNQLNQECCGSFQGKVLHCLSHFDGEKNKEILSVACFPDTEVEPGYVINITFNNGSPQKGLIPCEAGHFQPDYRRSSKIRHPYCHKSKIQCSGEDKRQLFCNGGTVKDDQCMCMPGFEPHNWKTSQSKCSRGFTSTDMCHCVEAPCPLGQKRNIDYMYVERRQCPIEVSINYTCVDIEETLSTELATISSTQYVMIGNNKTENPIKRDSNATLKPVTPSNNETPNQDLLYLLLLIPIIALLVGGAIVFVLYKSKIRQIDSYYFHKIKPTNKPSKTPAVDIVRFKIKV